MRQIVEMKLEGTTLVGTYHRPRQDDQTAPAKRFDKGLLILNTGAAPRSGDGDLNVQLADRMMDLGYHVFRFDMPGLGDSPGDLPEQVHSFHLFVKKGGNSPHALSLMPTLRQKYGLKGLVLLGNCGGSVTALYAAAQKPEGVLGLIHLDPVFHTREESQERNAQASHEGSAVRVTPPKQGIKQAVRKCLNGIPGAQVAADIYRAIAKRGLPKDTCFPLVQRWKQLVDRQMPMLVFLSHHIQDDVYLRVLLRKPSPRTTCIEIMNTNHFFTTDGGKAEVFTQVQRWLLENVPPQNDTAVDQTANENGVSETIPA